MNKIKISVELLKRIETSLARCARSMAVHPDCEKDSEFEGFSDSLKTNGRPNLN